MTQKLVFIGSVTPNKWRTFFNLNWIFLFITVIFCFIACKKISYSIKYHRPFLSFISCALQLTSGFRYTVNLLKLLLKKGFNVNSFIGCLRRCFVIRTFNKWSTVIHSESVTIDSYSISAAFIYNNTSKTTILFSWSWSCSMIIIDFENVCAYKVVHSKSSVFRQI